MADMEYRNGALCLDKLDVGGFIKEVIDDPECRSEIKTDSENKIISYRDSDGILHEEIGIKLTRSGLINLSDDFKNANAFISNTDWSSYISEDGAKPLNLSKPRCAKINIIAENFSIPSLTKEGEPNAVEGVNYNVPTYIEFFDMNGNYFRKPILISAQGQASLYNAKKNLAIDLFDSDDRDTAFKVKFGDWIACDSFHLKSYYNDENKSRSVVAYQVYNDMVKTRGLFKDYVWKRALIDSSVITPTNTGLSSTDEFIEQLDSGARCFPDGFPVILYCNGDFYGIYVMLLKKHRDNYKLGKKNAKNVWLDTVIYDIWNMNGDLDWRIFSSTRIDTMASLRGMEIRNPKNLYCVKFTYSYEVLEDGWEKTAVYNKPQYQSYSGDPTTLSDAEIKELFNGFPPAYLYDSDSENMYRIKQNKVDGKCIKYNFDDPNKRSELIDASMSCYNPDNEDHVRTAKVKNYMIELSKIYPSLQLLDNNYTSNPTKENLDAFKEKFEKHFDVDNLIDYQIICQLIYNWDSWGNNWLWFTYDGTKWFCGLYDCDATWGIGPRGNADPIDTFIGQKMYVMLIKYYKSELVDRYLYLRHEKIIDREHIIEKFLNFYHAWGYEYFKQEFEKWRQNSVNDSLFRIAAWIDKNIENMDALYIND